MSKAVEAGKTFLAGVLAKIADEGIRAQVQAAFENPASSEALVVIGAGALAQADINRGYADLQAKAEAVNADFNNLKAWHEENKLKLDGYDALKAENDRLKGTPPTTPVPAPVPPNAVTQEQLAEIMRREQMAAANFLALQNAISLQHMQMFGEVIDTRELLADPKLGSQLPDGRIYGLKDAYQTKYSTQLTEKQKVDEQARIDKLVADGVAEKMKGISAQAPYPIKGGADSSPLSALDQKPDPAAQTVPLVDQAAAHYARLQEARG